MTCPSNTTHTKVISIGAVDWNDFPLPNGTDGILMDYSSQGPSNSGMSLPDLVGPTNTQGFTYTAANGGFGGTSCSTPNAAGALVAYWSSVNQYTETAVHWLYVEQSRLHRDWGAAGADQLYGRGGASLAPFAANTVWLARGYGNTGNLSNGPFFTLAAAYQSVPAHGRIVALPGSYPELAPLLTKIHRIEGFDGVAVFGQ